jgi:hypothetical protein
MEKRRTREDILRIVEEFEQSGLKRRQFCERNNLPVTTLDYWRWKKAKAAKPRLVPVAVQQPESSGGFSLALANGRRIESLWKFPEADLARLIRIVESA